MLSKKYRLDKRAFNYVYSNGRNISSKIGYFKVVKRDADTQFSCVATKKDTKKSVDRTRIRRRGYAAAEKEFDSIPDGYGIIWFLPPKALDVDMKDLVESVKTMITSLDGV